MPWNQHVPDPNDRPPSPPRRARSLRKGIGCRTLVRMLVHGPRGPPGLIGRNTYAWP